MNDNAVDVNDEPESKLLLKEGQMIIIKGVDNPFLVENRFPPGTIGVFMGYAPGSKKFLPGLEPINVLIEGAITRFYRDEITVIE